jgi:group I intron endonuclease
MYIPIITGGYNMSNMIVYFLRNEQTGKSYIGSTSNFRDRSIRHLRELKDGNHHCITLQQDHTDLTEYTFTTIEGFETREKAYEFEGSLIKKLYNNPLLYNIGKDAIGGDNLTGHPNKVEIIKRRTETAQKNLDSLSKEEKCIKYGMSGSKNGMYGKTHTDEVKAMQAKRMTGTEPGNKGKSMSPDGYQKLLKHIETRDYDGERNPFYGRKHSTETVEKIRLMNMGRPSPNRKRAEIDGVIYESATAAGTELGIERSTLTHRIRSKSKIYSDYNYLE